MLDWDSLVLAPVMGVFGESVIHTPRDGMPTKITGIFDNAYLKDVMFEDGTTGVTETQAVLGVQVSSLEIMPAQNDTIYVERTAATYIVRDVRFDGHGGAKLLLSKASQW